jgi:hypothetical protein
MPDVGTANALSSNSMDGVCEKLHGASGGSPLHECHSYKGGNSKQRTVNGAARSHRSLFTVHVLLTSTNR